ncbi:MAG: hypothetical protein MR508_01685 [Lachnospiraceae bacterium]|nr:hypothetical protein [Lachnospiraceae bacterium]
MRVTGCVIAIAHTVEKLFPGVIGMKQVHIRVEDELYEKLNAYKRILTERLLNGPI